MAHTPIRIAVDAMGGDFAPAAIVAGAYEAVRFSQSDFEIVLFGDEEKIRAEQAKLDATPRISISPTTEVIEMHESPTVGIRTKRNSSIIRGLESHHEDQVQGFVSAGNTGAVMAASTLTIGRIQNVSRPTIGTFMPSAKGVCLIVDAGANVDCKARHLLEFGIMGSIYTKYMFDKPNPTVGLLSIGEEDTKGNEVTLETHALMKKSKLNFVGNVEGRDILKGSVDVVVCDGFVGNIVLKFAEGVPSFLKSKFKDYASQGFFKKIWMGLMSGTLRTMLKDMNYEEYGGVPLLGVNGVSIIGHGKSTPKAIRNMILKADEMIQRKINKHIEETMKDM